MALLTLRNVHKAFADAPLLDGVSLQVEAGARIGLLGANGAGKSTLLSILAGREKADEGEREASPGLTIGWLEQEPRLPGDATIRDVVRGGLADRNRILGRLEEIHADLAAPVTPPERVERLLAEQARLEDRLAALGGYNVEHRVEAIVRRLGLSDLEATCAHLSGGEARRVALARLLVAEPQLLLLDEPTNHLDALTTDWLEDVLLASPAALVLITHDRYLLDRVAQRIVELERGHLFESAGGYGDYLVARAARMESERRTESARSNLLRRETAWMRRGPPARSTKAKARIERYDALVDAAPKGPSPTLAFTIPPGPRLGTRGIVGKGLAKGFGGVPLFEGLDVEIGPGQRLGIAGPNGCGKSTFLRLCLEQLAPDAGTLTLGETVRLAAIDQKRSDLDPERSVLEEVAGHGGAVRVGAELRSIESFLEQFLFPGAAKHTLVKHLSGGERNRVLLAKLLTAGGNVLVLDEPTNDLDLPTLRALEEALEAFPGAVLVVSHDRWFLDRVATHVLLFDGRGGWRLDAGDLSGVLERIAAEEAAGGDTPPGRSGQRERSRAGTRRTGGVGGTRGAGDRRAAGTRADSGDAPTGAGDTGGAPRRLTNWELAELDALPARIETEESAIAALDARLADPALYSGPADEREDVVRDRERRSAELAELYRRWEELESAGP